jgi:predicted dehydrogenase
MFKSIFIILMLMLASVTGQSQQKVKPFRIGVAGLTHGHVGWILDRADDGDIEIVGIAEPDRVLAEQYCKKYNLPLTLLYSSVSEMLDKSKPEAVTGFSSTFDHLEIVKACAPRKIHVMVEKPLAVSLDHARQIQALAQKYSIYVLTNYETTWYGSNRNVEEMFIKTQPLGKLRKAVIHDGHQGPKEIGVGKEFLDWLTDPVKNGGGALMDFGCYGANLLTWLKNGKRPLTVSATTQQLKPGIYPRVEDEATIIVTYPDGQGIIQASWNWPFGRKDMELYGETGYIIADRQGSKIKTAADKPEEYIVSPVLDKPNDDPFAYLAAVVRGEVKLHATDLSSLENNLIVVEILEAARQSAKEGRVIKIAQ